MLSRTQVRETVSETIAQLSMAFGGRSQYPQEALYEALLGKCRNKFIGATELCFARLCVEGNYQEGRYWEDEAPKATPEILEQARQELPACTHDIWAQA
jgi:hypothetical protein